MTEFIVSNATYTLTRWYPKGIRLRWRQTIRRRGKTFNYWRIA